MTLRQRLYRILESEGPSGPLGRAVNAGIAAPIAVNVSAVVLESAGSLDPRFGGLFAVDLRFPRASRIPRLIKLTRHFAAILVMLTTVGYGDVTPAGRCATERSTRRTRPSSTTRAFDSA